MQSMGHIEAAKNHHTGCRYPCKDYGQPAEPRGMLVKTYWEGGLDLKKKKEKDKPNASQQ